MALEKAQYLHFRILQERDLKSLHAMIQNGIAGSMINPKTGIFYFLVGRFNPSEKYYCSQLGWLFPIYGKMFQTTNQLL